jgi:hypothetical protein
VLCLETTIYNSDATFTVSPVQGSIHCTYSTHHFFYNKPQSCTSLALPATTTEFMLLPLPFLVHDLISIRLASTYSSFYIKQWPFFVGVSKDLFVRPPMLIEKINSGKTLQSKYLSPLANNLFVCTHNVNCQLCGQPLSGNLTICSRCPNAYHTKCAGSIPPSCPCSSNPYKGLKSTITNGYRNYSTIFQHFSYPL